MLIYPPIIESKVPRIAFYGPMASGKTYAADKLYDQFKKVSLAAPLKATAREYYNVTGKTNDERKILQELADDLKKWDNDVFTKRFLWEVYEYLETMEHHGIARPIICDDLRFTHEADDLRGHGFILVRVVVPDEIREARIRDKYPDTDPARYEHRSEKDWKNIREDYLISGMGDEAVKSLREALETRLGYAS